jgi:hypothetical protein
MGIESEGLENPSSGIESEGLESPSSGIGEPEESLLPAGTGMKLEDLEFP